MRIGQHLFFTPESGLANELLRNFIGMRLEIVLQLELYRTLEILYSSERRDM